MKAEAEVARLENQLRKSRAHGLELAAQAEQTRQRAMLLEDLDRRVEAAVARALKHADAATPEAPAPVAAHEPAEAYRARSPRNKKLDPDARYQLLCQMAARARCARKNLSPSAKRRMIRQARALNALPDEDEFD